MISKPPLACLLSLSILLVPAAAAASGSRNSQHHRRAQIDPTSQYDLYDYVIVGGGLAGLTIASRLSEDPNTSVLVLEAGPNGDDVRERIDHPGLAYYNGVLGAHGWGWQSVPQPNVNNRLMDWPGGKLLGGSSAVNGAYYVRPSAIEVDAWHSLVSGMDGADNWTSDSFFAAMRKSETFTPPLEDIEQLANIHYDENSHGFDGPIHTSYPAYIPPLVGRWIATLSNTGLPVSGDSANGDASGAYVTTSTINPTNWTRSYARTGYIDPIYRPNLDILTNAHVTKIVFKGNVATRVEFGQRSESVKVGKEVIVTSGPVGSPVVLMHSGVGPKALLNAAGVETHFDLPGVGAHLQDHLSVPLSFRTNAETAAMIYNNKTDPRSSTDEFLSYVNSAIAYVTSAELMGDATAWKNEVKAEMDASVSAYPANDQTVQDGYRALYELYADTLLDSHAGQVELLLSTTGTPFGPDTIQIQVALQRPWSQGRLYINSSNPFDKPIIDPRYLANTLDIQMIREGLKMARNIAATEPLKGVITEELAPGPNITSDADWDKFILATVFTEFHPSCSCSMLPLELGGVVDAQLRVHGLANVRVADSSVFPVEFAAHMMAPTYGLAEQAAEMIKSTNYTVNTELHNNAFSSKPLIAIPTLWTLVVLTLAALTHF